MLYALRSSSSSPMAGPTRSPTVPAIFQGAFQAESVRESQGDTKYRQRHGQLAPGGLPSTSGFCPCLLELPLASSSHKPPRAQPDVNKGVTSVVTMQLLDVSLPLTLPHIEAILDCPRTMTPSSSWRRGIELKTGAAGR
jgi:hypothetical protein